MPPLIREFTCQGCGKTLRRTGRQSHGGRQRFCSRQCSARLKFTKEGLHRLSVRMKAMNPMRDEGVRSRMRASLLAIGHRPFCQGGNGRGLTKPQKFILEKLGGETAGWFPEHTIPVRGIPGWKKAVPDLAHPQSMTAVEIDGVSHSTRRQKEIDTRKEAVLRSLGWTVLRFQNRVVMEKWAFVLWSIMSEVSKKSWSQRLLYST